MGRTDTEDIWYCDNCGDGPIPNWNPACVCCDSRKGGDPWESASRGATQQASYHSPANYTKKKPLTPPKIEARGSSAIKTRDSANIETHGPSDIETHATPSIRTYAPREFESYAFLAGFSEVSRDDMPRDLPAVTPHVSPKDATNDSLDDVPHNVPDAVPAGLPDEILANSFGTVRNVLLDDVPYYPLDDVPNDLQDDVTYDSAEDVPRDSPDITPYDPRDDIPYDLLDDVPHDSPDDVYYESPDDVLYDSPSDLSHGPSDVVDRELDASPVLHESLDSRQPEQAMDFDSEASSDTSTGHPIWSSGESHTSASSVAFFPIGETEDSLLAELEVLIWHYPGIQELMVSALDERGIDGDQLERKLRRLLKQMGSDLRREASISEQRRVARFVAPRSRPVAAALHRRADDARVHRFLSTRESLPNTQTMVPTEGRRNFTLYESSSEDDTDQEDDNDATKNEQSDLERFKNFIIGSSAFSTLCEELQSFVDHKAHSSLKTILLKSAERATGGQLNDNDQRWVVNLASELQDIDPLSIRVVRTETMTLGLVEHLQQGVEAWTGGKWEWWPLTPPGNPKGVEIQWTCVSSLFSLYRIFTLTWNRSAMRVDR
jgi:hypothetical protein